MEQPEVSKGVLGFLVGGIAEEAGQVLVAQLLGHLSKEQILAVGHALPPEGGFKVGLGAGVGQIHGLGSGVGAPAATGPSLTR